MKKFFTLFAAVLFAGTMMADAITCAEARERALAGEETEVTVRGYVTEIATVWSSQYKNISFWMADEKDGGKVFEAYRAKCETEEDAPLVGALVEATGTLKNYNGTPEFAQGCTFVIIEQGVPEVDDADVVFTGADFAGQGTETSGSEVTATKDGVTFTCNKGYSDDAHATLRCYKNGVITITSETEQIGKLVFKFYDTYTGGLKTEEVINANEWTYELESQARIEKLSVFFGEYEKPEPVEPDTITVAQALEVGLALPDGGVSENEYVITGYVSNIKDAFSEQYGNETFWITDEKGSRASSTAQGAFEVFRGKPNTGAEIGYDAKIRILCKIKNYQGTIENNGSNIEFEVLEQGHELVRDTITVAKALEIGAALEDNAVTNEEYVISGYVSSIETYFSEQYGNETFWIADVKGSRAASNADGAFYVFRGKLTPAEEMWTDAKVNVICRIKKYVKEGAAPVIENEKANDAVEVIEKGEEEKVDTITVAQALEIGLALADQGVSDKRYAIEGFVSCIEEPFSETFGNETFWISDDKGVRAGSTTAGAFEVYRGKPDSGKELGFDAKIRIVCKIKNFHSTIENDGMNLAFEVLEQGEELHIDTLTVEKAIEKGMALPDGDKTDSLFVVSGYAVKAYDPDSTKSTLTQTWWMADDPDTKGDFEAYACTPDFLVQDNDYMLVLGRIQKYVSSKGTVTIELKGSAVHGEAPKVDTLTVAQALELGAALPDNTKTDERYAVIGYVASIDIEFAEDIQSFSLSDDNAAEVGAFKALNAFIDEPGAKLHDRVRLVGRIEKLVIGDASMIRIEGGKAKVIPGEGIETITVDGHAAQKIMVDGVIYIVRDNKIFSLQGAQVR